MKKRVHLLSILLLIPFFLFMVAEDKHSSSDAMQLIGKTINFLILFGGLSYLLYKPVRSYLEKRTAELERQQQEAEDERKEAEKMLEELKKRLETIGQEVEKIKKEAEVEAEEERKKIMNQAKKEAERIKTLAQSQVETYLASGIRELKLYTAQIAVEMAQRRIKMRITPQAHSRLIDECIEKLAG
ncbi:MAG: hypothetical protein ACE5LC_00585 [Candidatus Aminicenantales bacterium]